MNKGSFGTLKDGRDVHWYTIENQQLRVKITDFGATLVTLVVKDAKIDAVLGFDDVSGYECSVKYMGAMIGRVANRIKDGHFKLDGKDYSLYINNNGNSLHGGEEGFDAKIWTVVDHREDSITLRYISCDSEEGYPGQLTVDVTYTLDQARLNIVTDATTTAKTPVSLTNHAYFSLASDQPTLKGHRIWADGDRIGLLDENGCTEKETMDVTGTCFDLRKPVDCLAMLAHENEQFSIAKGLDHNYVLNGKGYRCVGGLINGDLKMNVWTDMPDMHIYTANYLESDCGKGGVTYSPQQAVCFETQYYPNCINDDTKISCVLDVGQVYHHITTFEFVMEENHE